MSILSAIVFYILKKKSQTPPTSSLAFFANFIKLFHLLNNFLTLVLFLDNNGFVLFLSLLTRVFNPIKR